MFTTWGRSYCYNTSIFLENASRFFLLTIVLDEKRCLRNVFWGDESVNILDPKLITNKSLDRKLTKKKSVGDEF